jgi:hypothetical protein
MTHRRPATLSTCALLIVLSPADALACVLAPFQEPAPPPPQPVNVRPWSEPPRPVVLVRPWTPVPPPVVVRPWAQAPSVSAYVVATPPSVVVTTETAPDVASGTIDDRGEDVRAARRVVVGGGFGGLLLATDGASVLSPSFGVHLGLALRQASVGIRIDMAPDVLPADGATSASYTIGGLGFGYHFAADSLIHPVVGASLDLHAFDPDGAKARYGFGVGARAGLEMEYPLDAGSLGIGLDVSGHRRFGAADAMPVSATALAFGGTLDYRF